MQQSREMGITVGITCLMVFSLSAKFKKLWSIMKRTTAESMKNLYKRIFPSYQHWEENWNLVNTNLTMLHSFKTRDNYKPADSVIHYTNEDIGIPPTYSSKKKKTGQTDPRFKRLIQSDFRRDADIEEEKFVSVQKSQLALDNQLNEEKNAGDKVLSFLKTPNDSTFFSGGSLKKFGEETEQQDLSDEVTKDPGLQPFESHRNLRAEILKHGEKKKSDFPASLKRSASDCTLNKKKMFPDEREDEVSERIRAYPSATSLSRVQNWMRGYNVYPEKRRSVITVIGQTQTKPFSKILSEINQRRKLAKELDKHALCETIMESTHNKQAPGVKNLVAKVDFVLPDGKVIYSTEKIYLRKESKFADAVYSQKSMEILDINVPDRRKKRVIPQRDSSSGQTGRKGRARRSSKRLVTTPPRPEVQEETGDAKTVNRSATSIVLLSLMALISVVIVLSAFFYPFRSYRSYSIVDLFRPKTTAWYEKLLF